MNVILAASIKPGERRYRPKPLESTVLGHLRRIGRLGLAKQKSASNRLTAPIGPGTLLFYF
jgi:hypothetical protein